MERRKFTRELKLKAVRLIKERGVSVAQACAIWVAAQQQPRIAIALPTAFLGSLGLASVANLQSA